MLAGSLKCTTIRAGCVSIVKGLNRTRAGDHYTMRRVCVGIYRKTLCVLYV